MSPKAAFTGGKLNLKGGNAKKKHKKHKNKDKTTSTTNTPSSTHHGLVDPPPEEVPSKRRKLADEDGSYDGHRGNGSSSSSRRSSGSDHDHDDDDDQDLTKAERKSLKFKRQQERKDLEKIASLSHRERVEQFNEKIGKLTEHNDIPRVSAAGNG